MGIKSYIAAGVAVPLLIIGSFVFLEKVDNGNVGIEYSMAGGVRNKALSQGVHWVWLDKVTQYPIKTQTVKKTVALATGDGKKTEVPLTYAFHVDPLMATKVYKQFGSADIETIEKGWLAQKLQKAGRASMAKYTLLEVVGTDSTKVQADIMKNFQDSVKSYGFEIEDLTFGTPSIDAQTQQSIDDIIKAGQDNKKAELEAKTKETQAQADANAKLTAADAEAQANDKVNSSVTDTTIKYMEAQARKDHGWVTVQGGQPIVNSGN